MRFLENLIYGLIAGVAEFLPVSAQAHQVLAMNLFGGAQRVPLRDLLVHIALIAALMLAARPVFAKVEFERSFTAQNNRRNHHRTVSRSLFDLQLVRTATVPMVLILLFYFATRSLETNPVALSILLIINGLVLIIPEHMRRGNKDSRYISSLESILIGVAAGLSVFPGVSRIGACLSSSSVCGAGRQHSANWAILLSLPALVVYAVVDLIMMMIVGFAGLTFLAFLGYIISAAVAFVGGYFGVMLFRFISDRAGFSAFAFYSWGMAMFLFVLYLIT